MASLLFFFVLVIGIWNLEFICNLVLVIWNFILRAGFDLTPTPPLLIGEGARLKIGIPAVFLRFGHWNLELGAYL